MRHSRLGGIAIAAAGLLALSACSSAGEAGQSTSAAGTAVLLIPGATGDGGFFDQTSAGLQDGADAVGWTPQLIEAGYEPTKWQPALDDHSNGDDDLIITGTYAMTELVEQAAAQHPDKQYVLFDSAIDPENCGGCTNVYNITYRYDETGFLAGVLAGLLEQSSGVERLTGTQTVGVIGGQDIPGITEFIDGFTKGVASVAPEVKVLSGYAGSFDDPVKGKAVAEDMIGQGAEILFSAAGGTDKGVFEAAAGAGVWGIGNAAAQAESPEVNGVEAILTSSDTDARSSISDAIELAADGKLPVGTTKSFGVKDGAVSITESDVYKRVVPAEVQQKLAQVTTDVAAGTYESLLTGK